METKLGKHDLISELRFDASIVDPETKDNPSAPQRKRTWLENLSSDQHFQLQSAAEAFLKEQFVFQVTNGETKNLESIFTFPDWDRIPPRFIQTLDQGAYFNIRIITPLPDAGTVILLNKKSNISIPLSLKFISIDSTKNELTASSSLLSPGKSIELCSIKAPITESQKSEVTIIKQSFFQKATEGIKVGYLHVIPKGIDHLLFIAALCFAIVSWKHIFFHSLAFTLCHSVTFILLSLQIIHLSPFMVSAVEVIIWLSIVAMAVENLFCKISLKRRLSLICIFGFIHGLGFANAFGKDLVKHGADYATLLVSANLGIELAQLSVIILLFFALFKLKDSHRLQTNRYCSILIILMAIGLLVI